jgi:tRNA nucleotidyltransferase/poly(A) polymerase
MIPSSRTTAVEIVRRLQTAGFSAFWVGGCVRDFLLGREPQDYDIATSARPGQVEKLFSRTVGVGKKFGVMMVLEGGHQFQVATFRAEADYQDGRHPGQVTFANAEADARRRDFTVNGLYYDPATEKIHDWVGGEKDLHARVIRTIGVPEERFAEDQLRLLRAVRFAAQLDFAIEPRTFAAVQRLAPKIGLISAERIRDELIKMFAPPHENVSLSSQKGGEGRGEEADNFKAHSPSPRPSPRLGGAREKMTSASARGLVLLLESGLLPGVLPELVATISCEQSPDFHPEGTVFEHIRLMLEKLPPGAPASLPWAVLLHDIAKPATAERDPATGKIHFYGHEKVGAALAERILTRLRFPKKQIEEIVACVRQHMQFKDVKQMRKATLRRLLWRGTFPLELALHRLDCLGSHGDLGHYEFLVAQAAELRKKPAMRPPLLTGRDLITLGLKPGPAMGALLAEIREKQLSDELKTPRQAKTWAKTRIKEADRF